MALVISNTYVNSTAPDANYPQGSWKNETAPGNLDGTPHEKAWPNDIYGFLQAALAAAGVTPNGSSDTAVASQYLQSIFNLRWYDKIDFAVGTKVVGSDGVTYTCKQANGPATTVVNPVTEPDPRVYWFTEAQVLFDATHKVGDLLFSNNPTNPGTRYGVGTWVQIKARAIVGVDSADSDFTPAGKTGGAKQHNHGAGNLTTPAHSHGPGTFTILGHTHEVQPSGWSTVFTNNASAGTIKFNAAGDDAWVGDDSKTTGSSGNLAVTGESENEAATGVTGTSGNASSLMPYVSKYIWERTA